MDYRPVVEVHRNPPDRLLRLELGGEMILSTRFHRFWKAGAGWVMARDLKEGDRVRTLAGTLPIRSITDLPKRPVFNLDVAEAHNFLVGSCGALVHDNSLPSPELRPFDRPGIDD